MTDPGTIAASIRHGVGTYPNTGRWGFPGFGRRCCRSCLRRASEDGAGMRPVRGACSELSCRGREAGVSITGLALPGRGFSTGEGKLESGQLLLQPVLSIGALSPVVRFVRSVPPPRHSGAIRDEQGAVSDPRPPPEREDPVPCQHRLAWRLPFPAREGRRAGVIAGRSREPRRGKGRSGWRSLPAGRADGIELERGGDGG